VNLRFLHLLPPLHSIVISFVHPEFAVKYLPRIGLRVTVFSLLAALLTTSLAGQSGPPMSQPPGQAKANAYGALTAVGVVKEKTGTAIEMIVTRPVVPAIQKLDGPPRLVIDLPQTRIAVKQKQISVERLQVNDIRVDQYQANPPVARVVVDLREPQGYSWQKIDNRLLVHLKPAGIAGKRRVVASPVPVVIDTSSGSEPAVVPVSPGNNGSVVPASNWVADGSSITAGSETTIMRVARGGEIRICPGTTVSVTSSQSGHDLMLGMSTGSLEVHYGLDASSDSIVTPDFRIQIPGPGEFDYAFGADAHGNTCVRALMGNTGSPIISELMGDRTYQVKVNDQLMFRSGRLDKLDSAMPMDCGCPAPTPPVILASASRTAAPDKNISGAVRLAQPGDTQSPPLPSPPPANTPSSTGSSPSGREKAPASQPKQMQVTIVAPFVFRASDPPPAPTLEAERLPATTVRETKSPTVVVLPPSSPSKGQASKSPHHGFFGKIKGFFTAMFG
jgi:hypothetical protein